MPREIKFRAWDSKNKWMIPDFDNWVDFSGQYWTTPDTTYDTPNQEIIKQSDVVIMQYTGLKDKNGLTEIYEDDIIDIEGQVIGNKYQNYELLKEPTNLLIQGFGTKEWETTNKKAMERGCKYTQ